jgi:hypothetical protein
VGFEWAIRFYNAKWPNRTQSHQVNSVFPFCFHSLALPLTCCQATGSNAFHHRDARNWKHLLFQSTHVQLTFVLVTIAGALLTLVLHSPHPWQVVDNCKTSMVELILQLLVHCLSSP